MRICKEILIVGFFISALWTYNDAKAEGNDDPVSTLFSENVAPMTPMTRKSRYIPLTENNKGRLRSARNKPKANDIGEVCRTVIEEDEIPTCTIYKGCAASGHIKDPRALGLGLILTSGCSLSVNTSCVDVYGSNGTKVAALGSYLALFPYKYRAYTAFGCGRRYIYRAVINRAARKNGDGSVYLKIGKGRCLHINKVLSNINSSQNC